MRKLSFRILNGLYINRDFELTVDVVPVINSVNGELTAFHFKVNTTCLCNFACFFLCEE